MPHNQLNQKLLGKLSHSLCKNHLSIDIRPHFEPEYMNRIRSINRTGSSLTSKGHTNNKGKKVLIHLRSFHKQIRKYKLDDHQKINAFSVPKYIIH
jgi:hypothetical protein